MMERALDVVADDFAHAEVGAEMTAVCVHHDRLAVLAAIGDCTAVEEVAADDFAGADFVGARDRVPRLMESGRGLLRPPPARVLAVRAPWARGEAVVDAIVGDLR